MGNSQSIEHIGHAVEKGAEFYKAFKQLEHEHEYLPPSYHYQQQVQHDNPEYTRLRLLAHQEAEKRNQLYEQSQTAYRNGNGAKAKELSNQGHYHDSRMKEYNKKAADLIFYEKNHHRPPNEIDLHGLFVSEAKEKVEEALQRCQRERRDHLVIIVGKGLHSPGQIAKLKPAIIGLVKRYQVTCEPNRPNPGCLYVEFGKGTGDLSWLDRLTELFSDNGGGCTIM